MISELKPVYLIHLPPWKEMENGILYISLQFGVANHLCACGCGQQTVMPFGKGDLGWNMTDNNGEISFTPSIGNFMGEDPYHAHYYITNNKIIWC